MTNRKNLATILAALAIATVASSANAADYRHLDRIAFRIVKNSEALFREFRFHYRHTSEYCHLTDDVKELRSHALHIRDVVRHRGSLAHLAADVREMDRLFHHLEDVVARVERNAYSDHHSGHIHGNSAHVASLLHAIEDDLHHLGEDVGALEPSVPDYGRRGGRVIVPGGALRVPVPAPPVRVVPSVPSRSCRFGSYGSRGRTSIPTPFGRLTIHH